MEQGKSGRALVVGGDSLVGSELQVHCRKLGLTVDASSRRAEARQGPGAIFLDLGDPDLTPLQGSRYDVAFVCAAVTSMQVCQSDPTLSRRINVDNTLDLMRRLADRGTHLVFLSSSQVFDGETPMPDEASPTSPKNEYGEQKLAVEEAIERHGLPAPQDLAIADALPGDGGRGLDLLRDGAAGGARHQEEEQGVGADRKSTRLNSSHHVVSRMPSSA